MPFGACLFGKGFGEGTPELKRMARERCSYQKRERGIKPNQKGSENNNNLGT